MEDLGRQVGEVGHSKDKQGLQNGGMVCKPKHAFFIMIMEFTFFFVSSWTNIYYIRDFLNAFNEHGKGIKRALIVKRYMCEKGKPNCYL